LEAVARTFPSAKFWFAPTLLWTSSGSQHVDGALHRRHDRFTGFSFQHWPRYAGRLLTLFSFVRHAAQDFSGYQSDGMLLEAGIHLNILRALGIRPGWGEHSPPSRASLFCFNGMFRIYFESGLVKLVSGDPSGKPLTAMDEYLQTNPCRRGSGGTFSISALVSLAQRIRNSCDGTRAGVDDVSGAAIRIVCFSSQLYGSSA